MDRLIAMQAFTAVVDSGSFTRAAEAQNMSTTAISRHVAELEKHLGARLLQRSTRRVSLTDTGAAFYERCRQILADVEEAESLASEAESRPKGFLRISLPHSFGLLYVAPLIPRFCFQYPGLQLEVTFADRMVDLVEEGIDVAVRISANLQTNLVARRLALIRLVACASPEYLAAHGTPELPEQLRDHNCLTYSYSAMGDVWIFHRDGRESQVSVKGSLRANSGDMVRLAALAGMGVMYQPTFLVADDLRSGTLVRLFTDYQVRQSAAYAVYLGSARRSARVRAFVDFFSQAFGGDAPVWDRQAVPA